MEPGNLRPASDAGALRVVLDGAREKARCSRDALTVLEVRRVPIDRSRTRTEPTQNGSRGKSTLLSRRSSACIFAACITPCSPRGT
jgi:hypothetical protein